MNNQYIFELKSELEKILTETDTANFNMDTWLKQWLNTACPALNNQTPIQYLNKTHNLRKIKQLLQSMQSGAYQ